MTQGAIAPGHAHVANWGDCICAGPGVSPLWQPRASCCIRHLAVAGCIFPGKGADWVLCSLPLRVPNPPPRGHILPSKMLSSSVQGKGTAGRVEREGGELSDPLCPKLSPHLLSRVSSPPPFPSQPPSPPSTHLLPSLLLCTRSGHSRRVPGLEKDPLTWLSLRWGRCPSLLGRPQLRQALRGLGPSGCSLCS